MRLVETQSAGSQGSAWKREYQEQSEPLGGWGLQGSLGGPGGRELGDQSPEDAPGQEAEHHLGAGGEEPGESGEH